MPSARGRGYATEAVRAVLHLAADLGVTTVRAETEPANAASQRVLEKAGFHLVRETPDGRFWEVDLRA